MLRSYLEPEPVSAVRGRVPDYSIPPGAVGGRYGSGCFHFSRMCSVSSINSCGHGQSSALGNCWNGLPYPPPARLCDVPVGLEQPSDVHGLSSPEIPVDSPVEGELERAPVQATGLC